MMILGKSLEDEKQNLKNVLKRNLEEEKKVGLINKIKVMNTSIERLEQIEKEREQTMLDPNYQKWVSELNVSQSYYDKTAMLNAIDIIRQYDYSNYKYKIV
jgi:hypothetical protein